MSTRHRDPVEQAMVELKIDGMTCKHCAQHVKEALEAVPGVERAEVDLAKGAARVEGTIDTTALVAAVEGEGYTARLLE